MVSSTGAYAGVMASLLTDTLRGPAGAINPQRVCTRPAFRSWCSERFDRSVDALKILHDINAVNGTKLAKASGDWVFRDLQLPLRGRYVWGRREITLPHDSSLAQVFFTSSMELTVQLVQFGLQDAKFATDVVGVLLKELATTDG